MSLRGSASGGGVCAGPVQASNLLRSSAGGVLVLALLCTYGLVITTSVRQADLAKAAALSLSNARMACETLPLARARSSCTEAATRVERDRNSIESAFAH